MKNLFRNLFAYIGLAVYYVFSVIIRIPVFFVLFIAVSIFLLIYNPIKRGDASWTWLNKLYDWYCGK